MRAGKSHLINGLLSVLVPDRNTTGVPASALRGWVVQQGSGPDHNVKGQEYYVRLTHTSRTGAYAKTP